MYIDGTAYGIEVETEWDMDNSNPPTKCQGWSVSGDGSLRNVGLEYITREPGDFEATVDKVLYLYKLLAKREGGLFNFRTAVHVHQNTHHWSNEYLLKYILSILSIDRALVEAACPEREGNMFCLSCAEAEGQLQDLKACFTDGQLNYYPFKQVVGRGKQRYSAVNLCSLRTHGTIEYRFLNTQPTPDNIVQFLSFLEHFERVVADKEWNNASEQLEWLSDHPERWVEEVFRNSPYDIAPKQGRMIEKVKQSVAALLKLYPSITKYKGPLDSEAGLEEEEEWIDEEMED